jgi:L-threonylcarbamoyladenylate synthase
MNKMNNYHHSSQLTITILSSLLLIRYMINKTKNYYYLLSQKPNNTNLLTHSPFPSRTPTPPTTTILTTTSHSNSNNNHNNNKAQFILADDHGLHIAAKALQDGQLVAFPTETVYGLGANAFNETALRNIFKVKERPSSDPLIVHVTNSYWASNLMIFHDEATKKLFQILGEAFWPGPLTIVGKANVEAFGGIGPVNVLSAGTGLVGVRVPEHPIARALIELSAVPVAAPSANRFGHVSPTCAQHVMDDLGAHPILILTSTPNLTQASTTCRVGIESTVIDLSEYSSTHQIKLHRRGGITEAELKTVLSNLGNGNGVVNKIGDTVPPSLIIVDMKEKNLKKMQTAPGQLLTHYAPDVPAYLWDPEAIKTLPCGLDETVVVDFGGVFKNGIKPACLAYRDLSPRGDAEEACSQLFDTLRWTETIQNAKAVLLPDVYSGVRFHHDASHALVDRLYRASSGRKVKTG